MSEIKNDPVNHPNHYQTKSGLEVIDAIRAFTEDCQGIEGYYTGNTIKYICRWKKKNGLEDLKKARMYLNWLIDHEEKKHPHHSGPNPFSEMAKEDVKRELNRIYGVPHEEATRIKMESIMADLKDLLEFLSESEKEKKEPPKNGRCSMGENDCFVPWILKPHMAPSYTYPASGEYCCCESKMWESSDPEPNRPKDIVEIIWTEFWRIFYETLREVSEEEKEKKDEK